MAHRRNYHLPRKHYPINSENFKLSGNGAEAENSAIKFSKESVPPLYNNLSSSNAFVAHGACAAEMAGLVNMYWAPQVPEARGDEILRFQHRSRDKTRSDKLGGLWEKFWWVVLHCT